VLLCNNYYVLLFADVGRVTVIAALEAIIHHLMSFSRQDCARQLSKYSRQ
jgi:hypothetical protein